MNININYEDPSFQHDEYEKVIDRVCEEAALVYGLGPNAEISILLCHNDYIHQLNKQYRNIGRRTSCPLPSMKVKTTGMTARTRPSWGTSSFLWKKSRNRPMNTATPLNGNWPT